MKIALGIEYDGRFFDGWQTQPSGNTVQDFVQEAIFRFTGERVVAMCAGRTDAAVHATGQVAHIETNAERSSFSWVRALNSYLPKSCAVQWAVPVAEDFHARFSARRRTYEYWIVNQPSRSPILDGRCGWVFRPLDVEKMQTAANYLLGEHDFTSFRAAGCQSKVPVKNIELLDVTRMGRFVRVKVRADAFLYHMVRNIVGSLVYVGTDARSPEWMREVLEARDRSVAAPTFYASGLYLTGVEYPEKFGLPSGGISPFGAETTEGSV
jgi:tRNA pseudouridine38-40 synthase